MLISCGNPTNSPATYTRLILPFAYCPTLNKPDFNSKLFFEEKPTDDFIGYDLKTISLESADKLPQKDRRSVVVAKIGTSYHIRVFGEAEEILLDRGKNEFLPDSTLVQELDAAFTLKSNGKQLGDNRRYELIKKITSNLHHTNIAWRKKYLTHETSDVLFKRAKWFTLTGDKYPLKIDMKFRNCSKNDYITIGIKPPELILFEWPKAKDSSCKNICNNSSSTHCFEDEHNILRTGFLVVELYFPEHNHRHPRLDNLLELNELFRYWQQPFAGHEDNMGYKQLLGNLPFTHGSDEKIRDKNNPLDLYFKRWESLLEVPIRDRDKNEWSLFPEKWLNNASEFISGENSNDPGWAIYSDNRTFVWTCAIMKDGGNMLRAVFDKQNCNASDFGHWIKLLNVDKPAENVFTSNKHTQFEKNWADERTYKRWEEWGTFYGFNYHSGAMLGPPEKEPPLWKHFGQMYFDQILLLLYIRMALFRFSMRLNRISERALERKAGDDTKWLDEFQKLRESFTLFTNLYQFPLLSNQQQAIEMYSLARKQMDVDDLFKEIQEEVNSNYEYLSTKQASKQTDTTTRLTVVATIGLVLAIATGFLGMNIIVDGFSGSLSWDGVCDWGILIVTILVVFMITFCIIRYSVRIGRFFDKLSEDKRSVDK